MIIYGCGTKNTRPKLITFKKQKLNYTLAIDPTLKVVDSLPFPTVRKYLNVVKTLEGSDYTPVLKYKDSTIYRSNSRFQSCRCKIKQDTIFMNISYGAMEVHTLTLKIAQNKFSLFARFYTDTPLGYDFKTLHQSLVLPKKNYKAQEIISGSISYSGIAQNSFSPEYPDYFLKVSGLFKCVLKPWKAFKTNRMWKRQDEIF
ncbi:hypothetical protein BKI52_15585 [marine bacterium AO1-C]|nr:hypothetical protein BKI52_15585 [marine bacterium AO1-C]